METNPNRWRRVAAGKISRMTPEDARAVLSRINAAGITIEQPEVRKLTGGFASQNVNWAVIRALAVKAGLLPRRPA